jgi:hypothetical protein
MLSARSLSNLDIKQISGDINNEENLKIAMGGRRSALACGRLAARESLSSLLNIG